MLIIIILLF